MQALFPSFLAGLATALGALVVLLGKRPGCRTLAIMLGGAAGVMLAVVLLDLLPAAFRLGNSLEAGIGFCLGVALLGILDKLFTSKTNRSPFNGEFAYRRLGYLIAIGIALHDLPEGIAIAGAYAAGGGLGPLLALSIAIHNIPEGIATAAPLRLGGLRHRHIFLLNLTVSIFTPIGTIIGLFLLHLSPQRLAFLLALAAGAMTYLIKDELIPAAHYQNPIWAWLGLGLGYLLIWCAQILK